MEGLALGGIGMAALFLLIALKVPIGIAMIAVGVCGFAAQAGWNAALTLLTGDPAVLLISIDLACVPLFLLMGTFASAAGFSADIYALAAAFLGHRKGGLAYATIGGCAVFGAVCGSTAATAATFTQVSLPEMLKRDYSPGFSAATIAAGGALKSLIPPSMLMILYCIIAQTFIFDLFLAAALPAVLTIAANLLAIAVVTRRNPALAPIQSKAGWDERLTALRRAGPAFILMTAVFGGLYSGIFTVNEAASVAAILAFFFALVRGRLRWSILARGFEEAAVITAMIYVVVFGASVFSYFLTMGRVPEALMDTVLALQVSPTLLVAAILVAYLILGAVFDEVAAMVITLPLILPIIVKIGFDPVWWGVMMMFQIELGLIIPPLGMIVFLIYGMAPQIPLATIYRNVVPFIIADLSVMGLLVLFPQIALWPLKTFGG